MNLSEPSHTVDKVASNIDDQQVSQAWEECKGDHSQDDSPSAQSRQSEPKKHSRSFSIAQHEYKMKNPDDVRLPSWCDKSHALKQNYKDCILLALQCAISVCTVITAIVDIEMILPTEDNTQFKYSEANLGLRIVCLLFNILAASIYITRRYFQILQEREIYNWNAEEQRQIPMDLSEASVDSAEPKMIEWKHIWNIIILLASFPPGSLPQITVGNTKYDICVILFLFVAVKLYFCFELIGHLTQYNTLCAREIHRKHGVDITLPYLFKIYLKEKPLSCLCIMSLISIISLAYLVRIYEVPYYLNKNGEALDSADKYQDFSSFSNSLWFVAVSLSTIGFGDFYPVTILGRTTIMTGVIFIGSSIMSLMSEIQDFGK
ncbi:unnamed protein product [Moneuplotes crassus]|uniref:Potassium channel domain-containing protein n=1 Tax=Euplotes crassus TaxID=5936 RepID=A0AAD1UQW0_EUPCR|nr:unnamed protein product [Moneuplotes crassus]